MSARDDAPVFIAADALIARHLAAHPQHAHARRVWAHLAAVRPPLITIPAVLDAAGSELARRAAPDFAAERVRHWAASRALTITVPDADDQQRALEWLERYRDPEANLADCWAWAVMGRLRIATAFTIREPFRWAGHGLLPERIR